MKRAIVARYRQYLHSVDRPLNPPSGVERGCAKRLPST